MDGLMNRKLALLNEQEALSVPKEDSGLPGAASTEQPELGYEGRNPVLFQLMGEGAKPQKPKVPQQGAPLLIVEQETGGCGGGEMKERK